MKKYTKPSVQEDLFELDDVILVSYSEKGHDMSAYYDETI